jgi:hypothetical protein
MPVEEDIAGRDDRPCPDDTPFEDIDSRTRNRGPAT